MAVNLLAATPKTISTLKKAEQVINRLDESADFKHKQSANNVDLSLGYNYKIVPCKVVSGDGLNGYTCDIYENGLTNPATKQGIVFLANGNSTIYTLPYRNSYVCSTDSSKCLRRKQWLK